MERSRLTTLFVLVLCPAAVVGLATSSWFVGLALAFATLCCFALFASRGSIPPLQLETDPVAGAPRVARELPAAPRIAAKHDSQQSLVDELLKQGRGALLLRPQIASTLTADQRRQSETELLRAMASVPAGAVMMQLNSLAEPEDGVEEISLEVEPFFIDRWPVTNRQFHEFVTAGGYEQASLWDQIILPSLGELVDRTRQAGPRYWRDGVYPERLAEHPVVGVSWHEAVAYARWIGKRLPTDPEWLKAAAWPVAAAGDRPVQRRYPWGDSMDRRHANLWGAGPKQTVAITEFPSGVGANGIAQLIGNVWEWTHSDFAEWAADRRWLDLSQPLKSLRGGAFDTYFDNQATCQFCSGERPAERKRNIGFRCVVSQSELEVSESGADKSESQSAITP